MAIDNILVSLQYIYYYLTYYVDSLKANAKSMIPGIERKNILNACITLPPLAEQERIVAKLDKLLPLCNSLL